MAINFQDNDPSLESQWRAIILFGKNSATVNRQCINAGKMDVSDWGRGEVKQ